MPRAAPSASAATTSAKDARAARNLIGLVPQELTTDAFETVWDTTMFSRGLFGKPKSAALLREGAEIAVALG